MKNEVLKFLLAMLNIFLHILWMLLQMNYTPTTLTPPVGIFFPYRIFLGSIFHFFLLLLILYW